MGQAKVLQVFTLVVVGQATPPWAAAITTERVRFLVPVAQLAEQAVKADHADTLQSTAQAKVLHVVEAVKEGQPTPPKRATVTMERFLVLEPVPQDLEQTP
jgi:hypothetical protein